MKILCFVLISVFHLVTCQHCTVPLSSLQCEDQLTPSPNQQRGLPGKRGAPGSKGEKGDPGDFVDGTSHITSITRRVEVIESKLNPIEEICDTSELERLRSNLIPRLAESEARVKMLEVFKTNVESQLTILTEKLASHETILRSCQDVPIQLQHRRNGVYTIRPNESVRPFSVRCYFEGSVVITAVGHDSEDETEVTCNTHRCHTEIIRYHASYPQMRALIELVGNCRQHVSYRCHNSILFRKNDEYSAWLSWNGIRQLYWGGADGRTNSCACGLTGTCADAAYMCNCDKNDNVERYDSGYFTNADVLPVHTLYFGDAGDSGEYGYFTLGQLQCMG